MVIELLFAALLALMPRVPQPMRGCIARHRGLIVHEVALGTEAHGVPPAVLLVVGMLESHYGCAPHSGGCWGAPLDRAHRATAGTPNQAAVALATSFHVCRTWIGSIARFRCGLCRCPTRAGRGYTPEYAARLIERVHLRAGVAPPDTLRRPGFRRRDGRSLSTRSGAAPAPP